MENKSCKLRRWQRLRQKLNNLSILEFAGALENSGNMVLLDVRTPEEFQQGHLPGAINISYLANDLWDRLDVLDRNVAYYVYCRTERRSMRVCMLMQNGGFGEVYNMEGGLRAWEEDLGAVAAMNG